MICCGDTMVRVDDDWICTRCSGSWPARKDEPQLPAVRRQELAQERVSPVVWCAWGAAGMGLVMMMLGALFGPAPQQAQGGATLVDTSAGVHYEEPDARQAPRTISHWYRYDGTRWVEDFPPAETAALNALK